MVTQVTYARTYNLGNYESLRLEAVASCDGDSEAGYAEARAAVETEYARRLTPLPAQPTQQAAYNESSDPATDKQRRYIATLQSKANWTSEQLAVYASEQGVSLAEMTRAQASTFIDGLKKIAEDLF